MALVFICLFNRFMTFAHIKLNHIATSDYDEFVSVMRVARLAYQLTPGGIITFNELLQSLRRSKWCRKELWTLLNKSLQQNPPNSPFGEATPTRI